jgi:drug/metabolite transporter (DMT)-like permease
MTRRDLTDLVLLAAIWGASFLFMRIAAPAFGPVALVEVRMAVGGLFLLPLLALRGGLGSLWIHARAIALIGVVNSAVPFVLVTYAMLTLTAAFASVLNATVPMWTALIAAVFLRERVRAAQWLGLAVGAAGVVVLVGDRIELDPSGALWRDTLAIFAALGGMVFYAISAHLARRILADVPPLATATGSQLTAALLLAPAALATWPAQSPAAVAWGAAIVLGVLCTAIGYLLYFRLIGNVGAMRASNVTYLIPLFATLWGTVFLAEPLTLRLAIGGAIVLAGTALALGVAPRLPLPRRA